MLSLLTVVAVGDNRAIDETWIYGKKMFDRKEIEKAEQAPDQD